MSVYHLVNDLCENLLKQACPEDRRIDVQTAKKLAFETLLTKSIDERINSENVVEEYQFFVFELLLLNKSLETKDVEAFIELLKEKPSELLQIAALLVKLKDTNPVHSDEVSF
jgi:hypothetical protein